MKTGEGVASAGVHEPEDKSELTMSTRDQTLLQLIDLAARHFQVPASELNPDDDFFKKLKINSLQTLDLLTKLESHFNVELPDYELQGVTDFRTLADRIQARL
jgi:acyl carrier protein